MYIIHTSSWLDSRQKCKISKNKLIISETPFLYNLTYLNFGNENMQEIAERIIQLHKKDFIKKDKVEVAMSLSIFILAFKGQSRRKEWRKYVGFLPWVIFVCIGKQSKNWNCIANLAKISYIFCLFRCKNYSKDFKHPNSK